MLTGGPMLNGKFRGTDIGSGTSVWRFTEEHRAGTMSDADLREAETCMSRSRGHCMTMGTASSLACIAEILGMQLPDSAAWPALDSRRLRLAHLVGATVTPEAVVFRPDGLRLYRGRLDNRYLDFGKVRPVATVHDLRSVLDALIMGKQIAPQETKAVGCFL